MQERRKKGKVKAVFKPRICHFLPPHWQSCATMPAKPCHCVGKVVLSCWQKIANTMAKYSQYNSNKCFT
ncbi:hypothetical protein DW182_10090 [Bacteroides sp. AM16-24]|nr:hypothetical protein DW182_10090 [Bacteroides sp. AM16-24]